MEWDGWMDGWMEKDGWSDLKTMNSDSLLIFISQLGHCCVSFLLCKFKFQHILSILKNTMQILHFQSYLCKTKFIGTEYPQVWKQALSLPCIQWIRACINQTSWPYTLASLFTSCDLGYVTEIDRDSVFTSVKWDDNIT